MSQLNLKNIPKDGQVIMAILEEIGINDFDAKVLNQLLEFVNWYTTTILDDARLFANHAKKKAIDVDDIKLAIQMHTEQMSAHGPPRDILLEMARAKNAVPLPAIKPQAGIRLPPDRYCLTQPNYTLKANLTTSNSKNVHLSVNNHANLAPSSVIQIKNNKRNASSDFKVLPTIMPQITTEVNNSEKKVSNSLSSINSGSNAFSMDITENCGDMSEIKSEPKLEFMELEHLNDHF